MVSGQHHAPTALYPAALYLGKEPQYLLDRRLGAPQSWSGYCGIEKNLLSMPGIESWPSITQYTCKTVTICNNYVFIFLLILSIFYILGLVLYRIYRM
jgi:hypothetical protein